MNMSQKTRKCWHLKNLFWFLSFICSFGILLYAIVYGFATGSTASRYSLTLASIVCILMTLISILLKYHWRCPLVLMAIALYFIIDKIGAFLICLAIGIILDELLFTPLYKHYKAKTLINKEIDARIEG